MLRQNCQTSELCIWRTAVAMETKQPSRRNNMLYMRPNRDYTKHLTWTYEMNKNLYDIYNEAKREGKGYMRRVKDIWDKSYPKHNDLTSKHLREQIMRVINKCLIRETGLVVESDRAMTRNSEQDNESAETSTENIENIEINNTNTDIHIEIQQEG